MVSLADEVGCTVRHYLDRYAAYAMARLGDDANIALGQNDWSRFQLLERAKLRMMRLQYLATRYPGTIAAEAAMSRH